MFSEGSAPGFSDHYNSVGIYFDLFIKLAQHWHLDDTSGHFNKNKSFHLGKKREKFFFYKKRIKLIFFLIVILFYSWLKFSLVLLPHDPYTYIQ